MGWGGPQGLPGRGGWDHKSSQGGQDLSTGGLSRTYYAQALSAWPGVYGVEMATPPPPPQGHATPRPASWQKPPVRDDVGLDMHRCVYSNAMVHKVLYTLSTLTHICPADRHPSYH